MMDFDDWFIRQFGRRESFMHNSDEELMTCIEDGEAAREEMEHRREWDRKYDAALKAMVAFKGEST